MDQRAYKIQLAQFGRFFALLLNRTLMYQVNHPFIKQSITDLMSVATRLLENSSPLVFILNRDQFYMDDELLDPRINVNRTIAIFKSAGLQSISFEKGIMETELSIFSEIFGAMTKLTTVASVQEDLIKKGVFNIKVNHVIFKKVTQDDQIVSRDALKNVTPLLDSDDPQNRRKFMETLLESIVSEEFAKTLNITSLLANPKALGQHMIDTDLAGTFSLNDRANPDRSGASSSPGGASSSPGGASSSPGGTSHSPGGTSHSPVAASASPAQTQPSGGVIGQATLAGDGNGPHPVGQHPAMPSPVKDGLGEHGLDANGSSQGTLSAGIANLTPTAQDAAQAAAQDGAAPPTSERGTLLLKQIEIMHHEVEKQLFGGSEITLPDLAQAIFDMKKQLMEGIQTQKALGIAYANEADIVSAANQLTDQVLVELIKEEYQAGAITTRRLAQIIRRLIPEAEELRRLLPQIKRTLLLEGMAPTDYLKLVHELRNELESEELSKILQESSEAMGLDGDMMIEEVKRNPAHAAELIYLASEIRKGSGDESALSDILVEYIEKLGERMAHDADNNSPEGAAHLKKVMNDVESTILKKLSHMNVNTTLLVRMEERLNARMESILDSMRVQWLNSRTSQERVKMLSVLQPLEHNVSQDEILAPILKAVRARVDDGEIEENNYSQIHEEIIRQKQANDALAEEKGVPEGVLNAEEIMFILDKEIARAQRYGSFFAALAFAFVSAKPTTKHQKGTVTQEAVLDAALYKLSTIIRQVDYIGQVGKNKMIVLLPMIAHEEARKALSRILRLLHASPIDVCGVSVDLRVAGVMTDFDHEKMPDAKAFTSARSCDGGAGATYVLLRQRPVTKRMRKMAVRK